MTAAEESARWHDWQRARLTQVFAAAQAREKIQDQRAEEERLARIESKRDHDVEAFRTRVTGQPPRTLAAILYDLSQVTDRAWYDPGATLGSEANPVRLDGGQPAQRSAPVDRDGEKIARAKAASHDPYMTAQRAEWHQRAGKPQPLTPWQEHQIEESVRAMRLSRRQPAAYGEITR